METQLDLKSVKAFLLVLVVALRHKDPKAVPPETLETLETQLEKFLHFGQSFAKAERRGDDFGFDASGLGVTVL